MANASDRYKQFAAETFDLVHGVLGASRLAFYRVDVRQNLRDFLFAEVPAEFHRLYEREMFAVDPLHVRRVSAHGLKVACMRDAAEYAPPEHVRHYAAFLRRFDVRDTLELYFRDDHGIAAGLNVTWTEHEQPPTAAVLSLAETLQQYIEFAFLRCAQPAADRRQDRMHELGLTAREREVARLVCTGQTNTAIAAQLRVKPSTVKTHLLHIYDKCDVASRASLVARLSDAAD